MKAAFTSVTISLANAHLSTCGLVVLKYTGALSPTPNKHTVIDIEVAPAASVALNRKQGHRTRSKPKQAPIPSLPPSVSSWPQIPVVYIVFFSPASTRTHGILSAEE